MVGAEVGFYADFAALAGLRARAGREGRAALREVAREFEALFLQTLLERMRAAGGGDPLFDGAGTRLYREIHDRQLARELARGGSLGFADLIVRQLGGGYAGAAGTEAPGRERAARVPAEGPAPAAVDRGADFAGRRDFVARLWPHARAAARALGTRPEVLLAQAALETGWGQAMPRQADGTSSRNLFGIKAGEGWQGPVAVVRTLEHRGGTLRVETARFRAYGSHRESFEDYVRLLRGSPRYRTALARAADPEGFLTALAQAGYATDPAYARKVLAVLRSPALREALAVLKAGPDGPIA